MKKINYFEGGKKINFTPRKRFGNVNYPAAITRNWFE